MSKQIDMLALDFVAAGLELGSLSPAQKNELEKSFASITQPRLVVKRGARFRITPLRKPMQDARPATQSQDVAQPVAQPLSRAEIGQRLQRAAADGKIEIELAGRFYTKPEIALQMVPFDVCAAYGIPRTLSGDVQKSDAPGDESLSRSEIGRRILRAVQQGGLEPRTLGMFAAHPAQALKTIPADLRKSYGIPETWGEELRKSFSPVSSDDEVYLRLSDAVSDGAISGWHKQRWWRWGREVLRDIPATVREQYQLPSE